MDAFVLGGGGSFLGVVFMAALYGCHVAAYVLLTMLYRSRRQNPFSGALNIAAIVQFVLCTTFTAVATADVYYFLTFQFQSETILEIVGPRLNSTSTALFGLIDFITQATLMYRALIIWERRYSVIVVPAILAFASLTTTFAFVGISASNPDFQLATIATNIFFSGLCLSMAVNFIITTTIVARIWMLSKKFKDVSPNITKKTRIFGSIFFESGAIIFVVQTIVVALYHLNSPGLSLFLNPVVEIYGITPTVILIRIGLGSSFDPQNNSSSETTKTFAQGDVQGDVQIKESGTVGWYPGSHTETKINETFGAEKP